MGCDHHYFVADTIGVPDEGTVHLIIVCTVCGEAKQHKFVVAQPKARLIMGSEERKKENK